MNGIEYLYRLSERGSKPGLERIFSALEELDNPQDKLNVINVTGTNGKGSFCAMLGSALSQKYKVGVFSSPHLESITESIAIGGRNIGEDELSALSEKYQYISERFELTQFEYLTVLCVIYFEMQSVDIAIMEVGMGGRKDATNIFKRNLLSVITGISLDHTSWLGKSIEEIAREKSGIIKEGCPVYYGGSGADDIIKDVAVKKKSRYFGRSSRKVDIYMLTPDRSIFSVDKINYTLRFGGEYQIENALKVLDCLDIIDKAGYSLSADDIKNGLLNVKRAGRFELLSYDPIVIFDGGHNVECINAFVRSHRLYFGDRKSDLIVGIMADKEHEQMVKLLSPIAERVYSVSPNNSRALDARALADEFESEGCPAIAEPSFDSAIADWRKNGMNTLCCVGSLYSYADFKKAVSDIK